MPILSSKHSRTTRIQLVRWREVEGLSDAGVVSRVAERWPDEPPLDEARWSAWQQSAEYRELRELVLGAQTERERLSDLFRAAGGCSALGDVAEAAAYALALRAVGLVEAIEDPRLLGPLMRTVREAKALAGQGLREDCETRLRGQAAEHATELALRDAEIADLRSRLAAPGSDAGLRPETVEELERRLKLL